MTDEQMDARLRAAGERWRAENTATAVVEPTTVADPISVIPSRPTTRRRWGLLASAAAVAAALVVGGTFLLRGTHDGGTPTGDTAALEGHVWLLTDSHGAKSTATLYIDRDGNLVADDECTLIGGKAAVEDGTMTVTDQVVRYKSCTDQYGPAYREDGAAILDGASTFTITPDALTITKDGKDLRLVLAAADTPVPTLDFPTLVGSDWLVVSAKDANGATVPVAGDPALNIGDDGTLNGSDGCNSLNGTVTVTANQVTFGQVGGTEKYCPGDAGATEDAILAFMRGGAQWTVSNGELTMTKAQAQLVYRWNPPASGATDPAALIGTAWHLVAAAGEPVTPDQVLTIGADGRVGGNSGCAALTGSADVQPGTVVFTGVPEADSSCTLDSASTLTSFLQDRKIWSVRNDRLMISEAGAQAFAMVFAADSPPPPPTSSPLIGTTWQLTSITFGDTRYRNGAPAPMPSSLTLTEDGYDAKHVCYTNHGDVSYAGDRMTLGNGHTVAATPCPFSPDNAPEDQAIDGILIGGVSWSITDGKLTITNGSDRLIYSDRPATQENAPLIGTDWRLETAAADTGANYAATGQRFAIDGSGTVVASDGVNTISGPADVNDGTVTFGDLATTDIGSTTQDPIREVVDQVISSGDVSYAITGDALTLTRGPAQLIYRAHAATNGASIVGSWNLTTIEHGTGPDGTASTASAEGPLTISANGPVAFTTCNGTKAQIEQNRLTFTLPWASNHLDCNELNVADSDFVFGQILTGTCTYAIDGDQLTITKDGVGALVLTRS